MTDLKELLNGLMKTYYNVSEAYEIITWIGRGTFADVLLAKDKKTNEIKAIKCLELIFIPRDGADINIDRLKNEAIIMSKLNHPNILKFHECFQNFNWFCIVSEYCEKVLAGVLQNYLNTETSPSNQLKSEWFYKLSQGLNYLHDNKIIHRDLKPLNILFKNEEIKIADFGESKQILKATQSMTLCGTPRYMSPEMLREENFSYETDVWSLGCVFYEIHYLELAFDGNDSYELKFNILNRKFKNSHDDETEIAIFINRMLCVNKEERPSIKILLSDKYFAEYRNDGNQLEISIENNTFSEFEGYLSPKNVQILGTLSSNRNSTPDANHAEQNDNIQPNKKEEEMYDMLKGYNFDNTIYDNLVDIKVFLQSVSNKACLNIEEVIKQICETELRYVLTLMIFINDFLEPLSKAIYNKELKLICMNIERLKNLHTTLIDKLREAVQQKEQGRTSSICKVFNNLKRQLMQEYANYFCHLETAIKAIDYLTNNNKDFKKALDQCSNQSKMKGFKLSDFIKLPPRRVLQYDTLFENLNKVTPENHRTKADISLTLNELKEILTYLNESQRDNLCLKQIETLSKYLRDFDLTKINNYGHLIKVDRVTIKTNKIYTPLSRTRQLLLFDKALLIFKIQGCNYSYKETILLTQFQIDDNSNFDSKDTFSLVLHNCDRSKIYTLYFNNANHKKEWKNSIYSSLDTIHPVGYGSNGHLFLLKNFDKTITPCQICNIVLFGIFYQGYECDECGAVAHKTCLVKFPKCDRSSSTTTKGIYQWLFLQKEQVIEASSLSDDEKPTTCIETENRKWYCDVDRDLAEKILKSIPSQTTIFLVRPRQDTGYAISFKYNKDDIKHIKINSNKVNNDETHYFLVESHIFSSITELIQYYMKNSLKDLYVNSPIQTLDRPFRDALPTSIDSAVVIRDYKSNDDTCIELKKGEKVSVVDEKNISLWLVFNNNGHLGYVPSACLEIISIGYNSFFE